MSSKLFESVKQRGVTFRNRIGVSPMCQYSCLDGFANEWHLVHLGARALGGAGVVIVEATAVEARGRISPGDLGIWKDEHIEPLGRAVRFMKEHGAVAAIQLAHAGWKAGTSAPWKGGKHASVAEGGWSPVGVSAVAFMEGYPVPEAIRDPREIVAAFRAAAVRSLGAGFEVVELHAAHGYLMHTFHSPISNRRTDEYGGSFENRTRLTREIVAGVREVWPEKLPLWIRFSCTDWVEGGWTIEESVELARVLRGMGVDCVDCSSGGITATAKIPVGPGYQVGFAGRIRKEAEIATAAVGMITTPTQAEEIVANGSADFVLIARESLRDPHFPLRAAKELGAAVPAPVQYARAL